MTGKLVGFSGREVVSILQRYFGFKFISQKGSHIKLSRMVDGKMIVTVVPDHRELAEGTLHGILKLAIVDKEEFLQHK